MVEEIESHGTTVAFLSTPSVYYSINNQTIKSQSKLFDVSQSIKHIYIAIC
jgi:hypothetical protein